MFLNNSQNAGNFLLFVFSHLGVKMTQRIRRKPFLLSKTGEEESKLLQGSFHKLPACKNKEFIKIFHESQITRKCKGLVLDPGGTLKDYADLYKAQSLRTDLANMDANTGCVNLSRRLQIVMGKEYATRTLYGTISGIRRHLEETIGSELAV